MRRVPLRPVRGFTLIEVLLAVLALGLFFSAAFAKQAESVVLESRSRLEAIASAQVRCKMSEIELLMLTEGFPATDEEDEGPCCEAFEDERFQCRSSVSTILLPSMADLQQALQPDVTEMSLVGTGDTEGTSAMEQAQGFLTGRALGQILPTLQGLLEGAIRKVEVTVFWRYRNRLYDFTVSQYVTDTSQGALGTFLQADLVQRLLTGGNAAIMDLLFGGDDEGGGGGT
jgi:prepilin-type N-terminal cleavage/methylation domain-containing protein